MKTKMTRKRALELLEKEFGNADYVSILCLCMPNELRDDFKEYWKKINTEKHRVMGSYFKHDYKDKEASTLRLLTAFFFIEDTYK